MVRVGVLDLGHDLSAPVQFLQHAALAAHVVVFRAIALLGAAAVEKVPVLKQLAVHAGLGIGLPFVDHVAHHVDELHLLGGQAGVQRIAVQGLALDVFRDPGGPFRHGLPFAALGDGLHGFLLGPGRWARQGDGQRCGQDNANESILSRFHKYSPFRLCCSGNPGVRSWCAGDNAQVSHAKKGTICAK